MQRKNGETPHHGSDPTDFSKLSMRQERSSNSFLTRAACQSRKENVQQQNSGVQTRGNGDAAGRWAPKKRPSNRDTMNDSEVMKLMAIALHPKEKCFFFPRSYSVLGRKLMVFHESLWGSGGFSTSVCSWSRHCSSQMGSICGST